MSQAANGNIEKLESDAKKQTIMVIEFIKSAVNLVLKYYFLGVLIFIGYLKKIRNAVIGPIEQPVVDETRKIPEKDISLHGIIRTLTRLVFLLGLMWWSVVTAVFEKLNPFPGFVDKFMSTAKSYANMETPQLNGKTEKTQ